MKKIQPLFYPLTITLSLTIFSSPATAEGTVQTGIDPNKVPFTDLGQFIGTLTSVIFIVAGLATFFYIVIGGFQYITAGGDKASAQTARDRIAYALLGIAIIAAAAAIVGVAQAIFGIKILGTIRWPGPTRTVGTVGAANTTAVPQAPNTGSSKPPPPLINLNFLR